MMSATVLKLCTPNQLRAEVYVLEATIATLSEDAAQYRAGRRLFSDPVPPEARAVLAGYCDELARELAQRLERVMAECTSRNVEPWDPMATLEVK